MIILGYSSPMNALNQPSCVKPGSKPFVEQIWSTSVGPLFNFARYTFGNDVVCCNTAPTCCDFPHAQGYLAGLHFEITHSRPSKWYANLQFDGEWNAGYVNNTANTFLQVKDYRPEIDFGYNFFIHKNHYYITPFTGLGFYYLSTEYKNTLLTNKYNNLYVPIGFNLTWNVHPDCFENVVECFTAGLTAEYRIDAWTRLKITNDGCYKCPTSYYDACNTSCDNSCNNSCNNSCDNACDNSCEYPCMPPLYIPTDDSIKLNSRTQGLHVELVFNWFPTFNEKVNFIAVGAPFFDWNRFGSACTTTCDCSTDIPVQKLTRWYLGFHAQMGIRF
jgi:hypothetical protein